MLDFIYSPFWKWFHLKVNSLWMLRDLTQIFKLQDFFVKIFVILQFLIYDITFMVSCIDCPEGGLRLKCLKSTELASLFSFEYKEASTVLYWYYRRFVRSKSAFSKTGVSNLTCEWTVKEKSKNLVLTDNTSSLPLDFLPWTYAFPRTCQVGLYRSSKSNCHLSGSRYRISSSTVLKPATALFNKSNGKDEGDSAVGLVDSVWCCN